MPMMPGMLTPQQMKALAKPRGPAFDHLFLTGMIQHHTGALTMVQDLFDTPGAGQDAVLFDFATDVDNTQRAEIKIMQGMLAQGETMIAKRHFTAFAPRSVTRRCRSSSRALRRRRPHRTRPPAAIHRLRPIRAPAPTIRASAKGGLYDAGEAAFGLERLASLPKPAGFAPGERRRDARRRLRLRPPARRRRRPRRPPADPATAPPTPIWPSAATTCSSATTTASTSTTSITRARSSSRTSLVCPGGQGDVSVYGHLLFMSAEAMNGRIDCGTQGIPLPAGYVPPPPPPPPAACRIPARRRSRPPRPLPPPSPDRFRGVRIFDITDIANPKQVAAVQSCRGSHTHTLLVDPKDKDNVYIYISGTGSVRQAEELAGCSGGDPDKNPDTALFRIDIIKVPLAHPELAKIVSSPRIFTDAQDRRHRTACGRAATTAKARRRPRPPTSATTSRSIRPSAWPPAPAPATASCSTSRTPCNPCASTR